MSLGRPYANSGAARLAGGPPGTAERRVSPRSDLCGYPRRSMAERSSRYGPGAAQTPKRPSDRASGGAACVPSPPPISYPSVAGRSLRELGLGEEGQGEVGACAHRLRWEIPPRLPEAPDHGAGHGARRPRQDRAMIHESQRVTAGGGVMSECASFLSGAPAVVAGIVGGGPAWFSIGRYISLYLAISRYISANPALSRCVALSRFRPRERPCRRPPSGSGR